MYYCATCDILIDEGHESHDVFRGADAGAALIIRDRGSMARAGQVISMRQAERIKSRLLTHMDLSNPRTWEMLLARSKEKAAHSERETSLEQRDP